MYGCESWTVKKAERRRIDAFELWCWRRLLRVPWTARRSNQSFLKEISPGISLDGMMLKLKLQYFGHLMQRADSLEKTLMLGGIGGRRRRRWQRIDGWMTSRIRWTWVWVNSGSWWWTGMPGVLRFMGSQRVRHDWATELNWRIERFLHPPTPYILSERSKFSSCLMVYPLTYTVERNTLQVDRKKKNYNSTDESLNRRALNEQNWCTRQKRTWWLYLCDSVSGFAVHSIGQFACLQINSTLSWLLPFYWQLAG